MKEFRHSSRFILQLDVSPPLLYPKYWVASNDDGDDSFKEKKLNLMAPMELKWVEMTSMRVKIVLLISIQ